MLQTHEFKQVLRESMQKMAEMISQGKTRRHEVLPSHVRQQQIEQQLEEQVQTLEKKMHDGLLVAILALNETPHPVMSINEVVLYLQKCMSSINCPEALSKLGQALLSDTSWKSHLGISDKCMAALYQGSSIIFEKKEYDQAEKAFFVLCSLDPTQFIYWIGLGHSAFQDKNYEQAINAYSMASALHPDDAWPHIWAANTFEEQKDFAHAKMAMSEALNLEKEKTPKNHDLVRSLEEKLQNIKTR
jgi:tetratricopeptide (TPR) repeat protein